MTKSKKYFFAIAGKLLICAIYMLIFASFLYFPLILDFLVPSRTLNVLAFTETISSRAIEKFERETGIRVNLTYAEIDEQIYAKFKMNIAERYDVVNMSDYMIYTLSKQEMFHQLNHQELPNMTLLDENLMHRNYDTDNKFCIPHKWYVYGIAYDKKFFNVTPDQISLAYIFVDPNVFFQRGLAPYPYKTCMIDDGRDAVFIAAMYLFGRVEHLGSDDFLKIQHLLIEQKRWVEAYTLHSAQYFLYSDVTPIALMSSNYIRKILQVTDRFAFAIPQEGSCLVIENLAIPKNSKKIAWAHQFINFMISDEIAILNSSEYGYNSSNKAAINAVDKKFLTNKHLFPDRSMFKHLFIPLLPPHLKRVLEDVWLTVGCA